MTPSPTVSTPPTSTVVKPAVSLSPTQVVAVFLSVLGVIVLLTLALAFHYPKSSDTTSVLGVAIPALTAIVGAALGGGAGNAVGAAGKRGVQQDLTQAKQSLTSAGTEVATIKANIEPLFETLKRDLPSPAGESRLMVAGPSGSINVDQGAQGIDTGSLDAVTAALARIEGLVKGTLAQAEPDPPVT